MTATRQKRQKSKTEKPKENKTEASGYTLHLNWPETADKAIIDTIVIQAFEDVALICVQGGDPAPIDSHQLRDMSAVALILAERLEERANG